MQQSKTRRRTKQAVKKSQIIKASNFKPGNELYLNTQKSWQSNDVDVRLGVVRHKVCLPRLQPILSEPENQSVDESGQHGFEGYRDNCGKDEM